MDQLLNSNTNNNSGSGGGWQRRRLSAAGAAGGSGGIKSVLWDMITMGSSSSNQSSATNNNNTLNIGGRSRSSSTLQVTSPADHPIDGDSSASDLSVIPETYAQQQYILQLKQLDLEGRRLALEEKRLDLENRRMALAERLVALEERRIDHLENASPPVRVIESSTSSAAAIIPLIMPLTPPPATPVLSQSISIPETVKAATSPIIFHSYCWKNSADQLRSDIAQGRVDPEQAEKMFQGLLDPRAVHDWLMESGFNPWLDVRKLGDGEPLYGQLVEALSQSSVVVAFISDEYARSANCKKEWFFARQDLGLPVIPVIVGAPPDGAKKPYWRLSEIGFDMSNVLYIDARTGSLEPIRDQITRAVKRQLSQIQDITIISNNNEAALPSSIRVILQAGDDFTLLKRFLDSLEAKATGAKLKAIIAPDEYDLKSPFHIAAELGRINCLSQMIELLSSNASVFKSAFLLQEATGATAFHLACSNGFLDCVELLANSSTSATASTADLLQTRNKCLQTPLHAAAGFNHAEIVMKLLALDADMASMDELHMTPLAVCVITNAVNAAQILLGHHPSPQQKVLDVNTKDWFDRSPLLNACVNGKTEMAHVLLSNGEVDVNATDEDGLSPLLAAVEARDLAIVKEILATGKADVGYRRGNNYGTTALSVACELGESAIVDVLLAANAPTEQLDMGYRTPIITAASKGCVDAIKSLIKYNANVNHYPNNDGFNGTALYYAAYNGYEDAVRVLIDAGANLELAYSDGSTPLLMAARNGRAGVVQILLDAGASQTKVPKDECDLAACCAIGGLGAMLKQILSKDPKLIKFFPDENPRTKPLVHCAVWRLKLESLLVLKELDVDLWEPLDGQTVLHSVCEGYTKPDEMQGEREIVALLLSLRGDRDVTPAVVAGARAGKTELVKLMLASIKMDLANMTLLEAAVKGKSADLVCMILDALKAKGISDNVRGKLSELLLDCVWNCDPKKDEEVVPIVKALLDCGADPLFGTHGDTLPHVACRQGAPHVVKLLLEHPTLPDLVTILDSSKRTLLHAACYTEQYRGFNGGRGQIAEALLAARGGAGLLEIRDSRGQLPIDFAMKVPRFGDRISPEDQASLVGALLKSGLNLERRDESGSTLLMSAVNVGLVKVVEAILDEAAKKGDEYLHSRLRDQDYEWNTILHLAAKSNQIEILTLLVSKRLLGVMDINARNCNGETPLILVTLERDFFSRGVKFENGPDVIKLLLSHGADPSLADYQGFTPLHKAARAGANAGSALEALLQAGADVNARSISYSTGEYRGGSTVLHSAVQRGSLELIKRLVEVGADPKTVNGEGKSSLVLAIEGGQDLDVLEYLLKQGCPVDSRDLEGRTVVRMLAGYGAIKTCKLILHTVGKNAPVLEIADSETKLPPIYAAAAAGKAEMVDLLLEYGASISYPGWGHCICEGGLLDKLKDQSDDVLLQMNANGQSPFAVACVKGQTKVVEELLNRFSVDQCIPQSIGIDLVHEAARNCQWQVLSILKAKGVDVGAVDSQGRSPISAAILSKAEDQDLEVFVTKMTELGISLNGADMHGETVFHHCSARNRSALFTSLLSYEDLLSTLNSSQIAQLVRLSCALEREGEVALGKVFERFPDAPVDSADEDGTSALHFACKVGSLDSVKILLDKKANPNKLNNNQEAPIHYGHNLHVLVEAGADPSLVNKRGETILHNIFKASDLDYLISRFPSEMKSMANKQAEDGKTPFHNVFNLYKSDELVDKLLSLGSNVNVKDNQGCTPLHYAVNDESKLKRLIKAPALDVNARGLKGRTALHTIACSSEYNQQYQLKIAQLLVISGGIDVNIADDEDVTASKAAKGRERSILAAWLERSPKMK